MEIKGKRVFITGASRGIGRAVAKNLAQDKVHLHLVVRKNEKGLEEEMLAEGAASVTIWTADLSNGTQVAKLIEDTKDLKIDILFNNAGELVSGFLEKQTPEEIERMLRTNVLSVIQMTQAFLPRMLQRKKGKIINNSSVAALMHLPGSSTYSASKAAVWAFTDCLRMELKGSGVSTLNLITPVVKTKMFDQIEKTFGGFIKLPKSTLPPHKYAEMIREAILLDLEWLEPSGLEGWGLKISKYAPKIYDYGILRRFHRR